MARRGRGDGSIAQRKDGRWCARLRYTDPLSGLTNRLYLYAASREKAVELLDAARTRLRARKSPRDERITLAAYLPIWLEESVAPAKREATLRSYTDAANYLLGTQLARMRLGELQPIAIQHVLASPPPRRIKQLALVALRLALAQAVSWGILRANPAEGIKMARLQRRELHVLSAVQARRFLDAAGGDRLFALYYLALNTGMREGELFALEWDDVDLRRGAIAVVRTINTATGTVGVPKTRASRRRIELAPDAIAVLRAHRAQLETEGTLGRLVFPSTGGRPLSPSNVRLRSFLPIQRVAKIDPPIRFHDLRHTAATLMLGSNVHPKIVSERLGHASIAITMDTYQHVSPTMQRDAARKVSALLSVKKPAGVKKGVTGGGQQRRERRLNRQKDPR